MPKEGRWGSLTNRFGICILELIFVGRRAAFVSLGRHVGSSRFERIRLCDPTPFPNGCEPSLSYDTGGWPCNSRCERYQSHKNNPMMTSEAN